MLNERRWNRAKVPAVEAPAIKVRDDPEASRLDDVFAVRPWVEQSSAMVFEMGCTVWDELPIDSNTIGCNLHAVAGKCGDWLHQRRASIGSCPSWCTVAALKRDTCCVAFGAKLDKICRGPLTDNVEPALQRRCDIDADAEEPKHRVDQEKWRTKEQCCLNGTADTNVRWPTERSPAVGRSS